MVMDCPESCLNRPMRATFGPEVRLLIALNVMHSLFNVMKSVKEMVKTVILASAKDVC